MGASKENNYTHEEVLISQFGRALAHPARSRMINLLKENKSFRNADMCKELKMGVSSVHAHIKILKEADLIHIEYTTHEYHITLHYENYQLYLSQLN
jgi:predicted transcriptional regulator